MNDYEIVIAGSQLKSQLVSIFKFLLGAAVFCACVKYVMS